MQNITSMEIDPDLADHARTALRATGYPVTVITGDGAQGYPPHAPYDRIIATAAVQQVPYSIAPYSVAGDYDASLAIGMKVPGCSVITVPDPDAELTGTLWFVDPDTNSWANLHYEPHIRTYPVRQSGPRNLWDEIETAYRWWRDAGRPGPERWRIIVTPQGQQIILAAAC